MVATSSTITPGSIYNIDANESLAFLTLFFISDALFRQDQPCTGADTDCEAAASDETPVLEPTHSP